MDDDILLAIRFQANDHGIFDENLIQSLFDAFVNNEFEDIDDVLNDTFKSSFNDENNVEYAFENDTFIDDIDDLNETLYFEECELINEQQERSLRMQVTMSILNQHMNPNGVPLVAHNPLAGQNPLAGHNPLFGMFNLMQNGNMNNGNMNNGILNGFNNFINQAINPLNGGNAFGGILGGINGILNMLPVQVALTENALNQLDDLSYDQIKEKLTNLDENEQCSICLDKLSDNNDQHKYTILPCNHVFHNNCIKEYLKDYDYHCPICKNECGDHEAKIET